MKHVIVIETVDGFDMPAHIQVNIEEAISYWVRKCLQECLILHTYNVESAIAAVHEMYNAPKWEGGL